MNTFNWKMIVAAVLMMFLSTACSKKIMPPEIETSSGGVESSDFTASNGASSDDNDFSGSGGPSDSDFFSEEPVLESSSVTSDNAGNGDSGVTTGSGSAGSGSAGSGSASADSWYDSARNNGSASATNNDGTDGSSGSFEANPFDGEASGTQEARLQSFHATDDLKDIHFNFDQYDLDSNSKKVLEQNATYLKSNPDMRVEIQGHCDERGTNNYNIALGERRAHSTKKYLVAQGVNSHRVNIISYGEEKPFCSDSNENCWHQNRRAHFLVAK
jgi:peptidoglycan-associated lipoprotein